ncbi:SRPBCC family protein [Halolamina litorea]|uniref:CoxG family protein n=1 Tax=Halolamina litorea TaxID=1515593 RepID=A0ABD6BQZ1_9EURY|nr:SRPBCC family protein [Halolamina litorea]
MTVRVERTFTFEASPEDVWAFIADPEKRAQAISVVESYEITDEANYKAVWHVSLPIPGLGATVPIETEDVRRDPPTEVEFVGRSKALRVTGTHVIDSDGGTTTLHNEFVVDGRIPGVERFFKKNFEAELDNLEAALREELEQTV